MMDNLRHTDQCVHVLVAHMSTARMTHVSVNSVEPRPQVSTTCILILAAALDPVSGARSGPIVICSLDLTLCSGNHRFLHSL